MNETDFFLELPEFSDFRDFLNEAHYRQVPDDWAVIITDVEGSTKAISEGKYKIVNMAGAATIAAISNALGRHDFASVFGGDGALVLISIKDLEVIKPALSRSREIVFLKYGLKMRIGIVAHKKLIDIGKPLRLARFRVSEFANQAFVKGSGLELAEQWVKAGKYALSLQQESISYDPHAGLSCRWAALRPERFSFLTVLIKVNPKRVESPDEFLKKLVHDMDEILKFDSAQARPVKQKLMRIERFWTALSIESGFLASAVGFGSKFKIFMQLVLMKLSRRGLIRTRAFDYSSYVQAVELASDYRKYDETLRFVVDASREMRIKLESLLESHAQVGKIFYGLHESGTALMTCYVADMKPGGHLHFIDGGDGGYALAAQQIKAQMNAEESP